MRYRCWLPYQEISITGNVPYGTGTGIHTSTVRCPSWYCPIFFSSIIIFHLATSLRHVHLMSPKRFDYSSIQCTVTISISLKGASIISIVTGTVLPLSVLSFSLCNKRNGRSSSGTPSYAQRGRSRQSTSCWQVCY